MSSSFEHHRMHRADVKVMRDGNRIVLHIDASPAERFTIDIEQGTLSIVEEADAAIARKTAGQQRIDLLRRIEDRPSSVRFEA